MSNSTSDFGIRELPAIAKTPVNANCSGFWRGQEVSPAGTKISGNHGRSRSGDLRNGKKVRFRRNSAILERSIFMLRCRG